jgi:hypothetical protein
MKAFRQFGVVILLLVSYLTPAMACMVSNVRMNAEERACCQAMQNRCEQMGMPASHDCCQKAPQSTLDKALVTETTNYHPVTVAVVWLTAYEWLQPSLATGERITRPDDSPPQFPSGSNSVLRI